MLPIVMAGWVRAPRELRAGRPPSRRWSSRPSRGSHSRAALRRPGASRSARTPGGTSRRRAAAPETRGPSPEPPPRAPRRGRDERAASHRRAAWYPAQNPATTAAASRTMEQQPRAPKGWGGCRRGRRGPSLPRRRRSRRTRARRRAPRTGAATRARAPAEASPSRGALAPAEPREDHPEGRSQRSGRLPARVPPTLRRPWPRCPSGAKRVVPMDPRLVRELLERVQEAEISVEDALDRSGSSFPRYRRRHRRPPPGAPARACRRSSSANARRWTRSRASPRRWCAPARTCWSPASIPTRPSRSASACPRSATSRRRACR